MGDELILPNSIVRTKTAGTQLERPRESAWRLLQSLGLCKNIAFSLLQIPESRTYMSRGDFWKAEPSAQSRSSHPPRKAISSGQTHYGLH
jgi:hypothetical protein